MSSRRIGAELKDQASEKVDQAKDKANELASDAKKKGEGKVIIYENLYFSFLIRSQRSSFTKSRSSQRQS
jgi:hypothetical protein